MGRIESHGVLVARFTPLGWTVFGGGSHEKANKVMNVKISKPVDLTDFWSVESMRLDTRCNCGINEVDQNSETKVIEASASKVGERWLIPYPWVKDPTNLSNNKEKAVKMLVGLEKRLRKNEEYSTAYKAQMKEMVDLGFARKLSPAEEENYKGPVHYIPHHPVIQPEKKSTPVRVVFNSSNKFNGEVINGYWMKGPRTC
ncbi:hypothetical protein HOLleu_16315 [Holothuria leucospilota]|uniref:Uncharacterized protein n=1 Tax=Holothuria leucospilota TaxID=206669 RepID=A0A9Q1H7Q6_HOLLE|nr:hypothetical protein HOLleu_16315 [Holothuria leucospilota]